MQSSIAHSSPPMQSVLVISSPQTSSFPGLRPVNPQTGPCTFAVQVCTCMATVMSFLVVLLPCESQHSFSKLCSMDYQPSYSQPPVTKRHVPFPPHTGTWRMGVAVALAPLSSSSSGSQFPQPCPLLLRKGPQFSRQTA